MTEENFKRKLAAILSADVEGYSRLMGDDEEATVRTLTVYRNAITELVQQFRGRVIDAPGDNILSEFASVVDAVNCAVEIQRDLAERNENLAYNRKMEFRIGVNLGDVIEEDGRIYGDGVNIAARLESLADAAGICISGQAYDHVANKLELGYEDLGEHQVKNISTPVQVYRVLSLPGAAAHRVVRARTAIGKKWRKSAVAAAFVLVLVIAGAALWNGYLRYPAVEKASVEKMAHALPEKPSIAVLPFVNMSDDPAKEYLADGITEQIITTISKAPRIFVISRTSTFYYKGKSVKVQQVAEELGVQYVLEGSVQQSGDRIRITAQLIDALTGRHLWAQRYERDSRDIFAIQDEITFQITKELGIRLTEGEKLRVLKRPKNLEVLEKNMEALNYLRGNNIESVATARRLAQEMVTLDPEYPGGYGVWAVTLLTDIYLGASRSPRKSIAQAVKLLKKAIELDENIGWPHATLGHLYAMQRQYEKAIESGKKAIELNPNGDEGYYWLATSKNIMGKPEEAIELHKQAMRLCPIPPAFYRLGMANAYRFAGRYEDAILEYKKVLHLQPRNFFAFTGLAICYGLIGSEKESREAAAEVLRLNPKYNIKAYLRVGSIYTDHESVKKMAVALRNAGIPEG